MIKQLNGAYGPAMLAPFEISQGDSMEALLTLYPWYLYAICTDLIHRSITLRISISRGEIFEPIVHSPALTDGPAWWVARERLATSKNKYAHGLMFTGFGDEMDKVLTGIGQSLSQQVHSWTKNQREIVMAKLTGMQSVQIASESGISEAQVSKTLKAVNYHTFADLNDALGAALRLVLPNQS